jgi:hypothetical protein
MANNIVVFFDSLGRTILGELVEDTKSVLLVKNPAVLHAGFSQESKIQVNLVPALFREFLKDWNEPLIFAYQKDHITLETNGASLDDKLLGQYDSMWASRPSREEVRKQIAEKQKVERVMSAEPESKVEKLNLFDEVTPGEKK